MGKFLDYINEQSTIGTEFVDERQIDAAYDKSKYAVKLVQIYSQMTGKKLLNNISTISTLNQGVYGLYNSGENKKIIGNQVANKVKMTFGDDVIQGQKLDQVPNAVIKKYIPDIDLKHLQPSDVIRVNVQKHIAAHGDTLETVIEIASTIVHEATHEIELQTTGQTNETGPENASKQFLSWVKSNWNTIIQRIPDLNKLQRKGLNFGI
jgi:hypothetical protein